MIAAILNTRAGLDPAAALFDHADGSGRRSRAPSPLARKGVMRNNIGLFLARRAELSPALEGAVDPASGRRFDYAELNARANRTAHALTRLGVRRGDRVALLAFNCPEFFESFFALAKIGAVVVPLNVRLAAAELAYIVENSGAATLIYGEEFRGLAAALRARGTGLRHWVHIAASGADDFALDYDALQAAGSDDEPAIDAGDGDNLYIMYTSGTTGLPKGAVHTHESAMWACVTLNATADMRLKDRYLVALPAYHVGALTPLTANVHRGVSNVLMRRFDPALAWRLIEEERIDNMIAVPAMLNFMDRTPEADTTDASRLRWIMCGGAPVPVTTVEAYAKRGVAVVEVYGLTECCGPACVIDPDDAAAHPGSTGKPFFHTEARIVDADGRETAPGEAGELLIRGRHNMKEYWRNPEATREALRDGWLHTGDVARRDAQGFLFIEDRLKDMIVSGGENVYPAEVENAALSHPGVREVAVIGQPSARWGETPLAVVVAHDESLTAADLLAHCARRLARFKLPAAVAFVDEIPRNPTGKALKGVLRERFPGPAPE